MSFGELLVAPQVWPFSLALVLFFAAVVFEVVMAIVGFGADLGVDLSLDVDVPDPSIASSFLDWLGIGRVPYLVSLAAFLLCFGFIGLFAQTLQLELLGFALPWPLVAVGAVGLALPPVRLINLSLGRFWPKDVESSAVSVDTLIGREAEVVLGSVTHTEPGQIKVRDAHGTMHYGLAVADNVGERYEAGTSVLIVSRRGASYAVIAHPNPSSSSSPSN